MTTDSAEKPEEGAEASRAGERECEIPVVLCPMARMCQGFLERPSIGVFPILAGMVLIAFGVLIVIVPSVLIWLAALIFVAMGVMMMMFGSFVRSGGGRFGSTGMHKHP